jgi:hypothetical protein
MGAILPAWLCVRAEPKPHFMNQRCGLKGLAGRFAGHLLSVEPPQFVAHQRHQFLGRLGIALLDSLENVREVANGKILADTNPVGKRV